MGWRILACILLFSVNAEASDSLVRETFDQKVKWKRCEERQETAKWLESINTELESIEVKSEAECAQKYRGAFFASLSKLAKENPAMAKKLELERPLTEREISAQEVEAAFADSKDFSLLEWRVFRDWFGEKIQSQKLRAAFPVTTNKDALSSSLNSEKILWITDPYRKLVGETENLDPSSFLSKTTNLEIIELSPYGNAESQAEELKNILLERTKQPITLISSGGASAIVMKTLDLNPSLRTKDNIQSWINVEGKLYGAKPKKSRGLASAIDAFQEKTLMGVRLQYLDSLDRQPALGKGFPIYNIIFGDKFNQETREKILVEAETIRLNQLKEWEKILLKKSSGN